MKLTNKHILGLILLVALVLRGFHYFDIPFTHDEFSAFFRTQFSGFKELIEKGVKVDGHPAGIQVFLFYWIQWFGSEPWIVKLPFTFMGLVSVILIYSIGKKWFNETVGLLSASMLASTQYMVMYSQIARPYISGLFFSLMMVYFWTNLMLRSDKSFKLNATGYVIFSALCAYNHHFSLLFAAIVGITGLFFINKMDRLKYIGLGLLIFILYIPHLQIFFYQLSLGGVEGWLGKPRPEFITDYLFYLFNYSFPGVFILLAVLFYGVLKEGSYKTEYRLIGVAFLWFCIPFAIGYFYSVYVNSVLQFSVLIFSHGFLYIALLGFIKPQKTMFNLILVLLVLSINSFTLIYQRKHYQLFYHSPFKEVLLDYQKLGDLKSKTLSIIDSDPENKQYYLRKLSIDSTFISFDSLKSEHELISLLKKNKSQKEYLYFGCQSNNPAITVPIIQQFYPTLVWQKNYAGGTSYLFSGKGYALAPNVVLNDFEKKSVPFFTELNELYWTDSLGFSGKYSYLMDSTQEWSVVFSAPLKDLIHHENNFIDISIRFFTPGSFSDAILAAAIESEDKNIHWSGTSFEKFIVAGNESKWVMAHHSIKLSDVHLVKHDMQLKIYVWNLKRQCFYIDDFSISVREGNRYIYGLLEDF